MTRTTNREHAASAASPTSIADYRARAVGRPVGTPAADARALQGFFENAARLDARRTHFHRVVSRVLARADRVAPTDLPEWQRFLRLLDRHRDSPTAALNCGVLANLVGLAAFGDPADLVTLTELGDRVGVERVAAVQHRAARFVEPDPTYPLTTAALRRMAASAYVDPAVALLLEGLDPDAFLPLIHTQAELIGVIDGGSVLEWRHHLAMIAASPWSPYSRHLVDLASRADRPEAAAVIDRFTEQCREQNKAREREQVAEEVRRLVSESGVTQREFARWAGTSPSRLSTYVLGSVTPSASLMLRMARTSRLLQERDVTRAPSTSSEQSWGAARTVDAGKGGAAGPAERASGSLVRDRSHLSAV